MKLEKVQVRCGCGALIEADCYDQWHDMLSGNTCPGCGRLITSNVSTKKDGFALFIRRTKYKFYHPTYWRTVEP